MSADIEYLAEKEASGGVDGWTETLCLEVASDFGRILSNCSHEVVAYVYDLPMDDEQLAPLVRSASFGSCSRPTGRSCHARLGAAADAGEAEQDWQTSFQTIGKAWTKDPLGFKITQHHLIPEPHT